MQWNLVFNIMRLILCLVDNKYRFPKFGLKLDVQGLKSDWVAHHVGAGKSRMTGS